MVPSNLMVEVKDANARLGQARINNRPKNGITGTAASFVDGLMPFMCSRKDLTLERQRDDNETF